MPNFVTRVTAHDFIVQEDIEPLPKTVGHLIVSERQVGSHPVAVDNCTPQYGFELTDSEGNIIAHIAPGWYEAFHAVVSGFIQGYTEQSDFKADWFELRKILIIPNLPANEG